MYALPVLLVSFRGLSSACTASLQPESTCVGEIKETKLMRKSAPGRAAERAVPKGCWRGLCCKTALGLEPGGLVVSEKETTKVESLRSVPLS